jgi:4-amino-4-deoxy-L-arabinose transferase-like glycosyltransferase
MTRTAAIVDDAPGAEPRTAPAVSVRRVGLATLVVFLAALAALAPTTGDFGLTYDEPAYTFSQHVSAQWWERLGQVRSWDDLARLLDRDTLLYYWPYARFGINFHPPLAGQLNILTHALFSGFLNDIVARRLATVVEFALAIALLFAFLARRYGTWTGLVAAGSLLLMPRLYGQAHLIDTDMPGLLLWVAAALAFWKGLNEPRARRWRVLVGVLLGLAFVEKMGTVMVALPILAWLAATRLPRAFLGDARERRGLWIDALVTTTAMLAPLAVAFVEIQRLAGAFLEIQRRMGVPPDRISHARTDLFREHPTTWLPGAILAVPLVVWLVRRALARLAPRSPIWRRERPGLETVWAILAFAPLVAWLGNPGWWVETLPRLGHYYGISTARQGVLPRIQILYFGQIYEYSLPWHNAFVLIAITVPVSTLLASIVGLIYVIAKMSRDRLPLFFLVNLLTLPMLRMLDTPAHDGVRLFLPTFAFLAALAGWGAVWVADGFSGAFRARAPIVSGIVAVLVLAPAASELILIHPYELSYYNTLIGGPRGAWRRGFELTYWYDAFTPRVLNELNEKFPEGAAVGFPNHLSSPATFQELQSLGMLRGDIRLDATPPDAFPYLWLLTHDSKAQALTRLLFALRPWYTDAPRQLGGARVVTVADPKAAARALALQLLLDRPDRSPPEPPSAPEWVRRYAPFLARFWGDGLVKIRRLTVNDELLDWARSDPDGLRAAARSIADWARAQPSPNGRPAFPDDPGARRLYAMLTFFDDQGAFSADLLRKDPHALVDAVEIIARRPDAVRRVLTHAAFTDPGTIGGYLDRDLD